MYKEDECVVLFSGGTDSTLAAALQQENFNKVHLVTYDRFGIYAIENSKVNAQMLIDKYGPDRMEHHLINIDNIFKHVSYEKYLKNIIKHKLMLLSTCGLCKLAMHIRTVKFCQDNKIKYVSDGANQGMNMFPAQMKGVIDQLKKMYEHFGIQYSNPVFEYEPPEEGGFVKMENLHLVSQLSCKDDDGTDQMTKEQRDRTTGQILYEKGLAPLPNVKGTPYDRKRQPRCFQFILFKIFAKKYFLESSDYDDYVNKTDEFFAEKIESAINLLESNDEKNKKMFKA